MSTDSRLGNIGNILNGGAARPRLVPELTPETDAPETDAPETNGTADPQPSAPAPTIAPPPVKVEPARPAPRQTATTTRPRSKPNASKDVVHRVPVRLDTDLRERLDHAARVREATLSEVAFDALEASHQAGQLAGLIEADNTPHATRPRSSGALFQRPKGRGIAQPTVLTEFRFTADDLDILDGLVSEAEAASRSQLIKVALREHLDSEK